jgi:tetratricopeptide (TPR) repeat protein
MVEARQPRVFLSYSRRDDERANALQAALEHEGIRVWRDVEGIDAGEVWRARITEAVRNCDAFVLAVSAVSIGREEVLNEVALAGEFHKPILPAYLETVDTGIPDELRGTLSRLNRAELYKDFGGSVDLLVRSVRKHAAQRVKGRDTRTAFDLLRRMGAAGVDEMASEYETALAAGRVDSATLVSLGQCHLFLGRYKEAREVLRRAVAIDPTSAVAAYMLALAIAGGRRPRALRMSTAEEIAGLLSKAVRLDPASAHYEYLAALVKVDYYEGHGLLVPEPSVKTLLARARSKKLDRGELARIFDAVEVDEGVWGRIAIDA